MEDSDEGILGGGSAPCESKLISWVRVCRGPIGRFQLVNWTIIVHRRIRSLITEHDCKAGWYLDGYVGHRSEPHNTSRANSDAESVYCTDEDTVKTIGAVLCVERGATAVMLTLGLGDGRLGSGVERDPHRTSAATH